MNNFKKCSLCGFVWPRRDDFLFDPDIMVFGYQVDYHGDKNGFVLFEHICGTTLAIPVLLFKDMYNGPKYKNILSDSEECPDHCLDENNLEPCGASCKLAYGREILQKIRSSSTAQW